MQHQQYMWEQECLKMLPGGGNFHRCVQSKEVPVCLSGLSASCCCKQCRTNKKTTDRAQVHTADREQSVFGNQFTVVSEPQRPGNSRSGGHQQQGERVRCSMCPACECVLRTESQGCRNCRTDPAETKGKRAWTPLCTGVVSAEPVQANHFV
jgi:hypothetical protein